MPGKNLDMDSDIDGYTKQLIQERNEATLRADVAQAGLYRLHKLLMVVGDDLRGLASALCRDEPVARQHSWMYLPQD